VHDDASVAVYFGQGYHQSQVTAKHSGGQSDEKMEASRPWSAFPCVTVMPR